MIVTVTLNAAIDRTLTVPNFQRGQRHRASAGVMLAGGKGSRLRDHATAPPKPLIHVGTKRLMDFSLQNAVAIAVEEIVIVVSSFTEGVINHYGSSYHGIPITYVPARNTIFLSYALAWAEVLEAADIFLGVNALDYSGYPDCRPEFIAAFTQLANLATKAAVEGRQRVTVHTPLIRLTKAEIIRTGLGLGVDYALTSSCYDPSPAG